MKVNALLMDEKDNVVTCVEEVEIGQEILYDCGGKICTITAGKKFLIAIKWLWKNLNEDRKW